MAGGGPTAAAAAGEESGESRKLFVGGIPAGAQKPKLRVHFTRFGELRSIIVMQDRETGHGRGFGFVEFKDEAAVAIAFGDGDSTRHFLCGRMMYSVMSFLSLIFPDNAIYFNSIREIYDAWVIYNFLSLCLAWVGGPGAVVVS